LKRNSAEIIDTVTSRIDNISSKEITIGLQQVIIALITVDTMLHLGLLAP
jgi:hypothetical protein